MSVEPVPGEPAAVADAGERALVVADYHAGIEVALRSEGVELPGRAGERREHVRALLAETGPDRLVVLGDLGHAIGGPAREEREEVETLLSAVDVPVTVVKGNHDGGLEAAVEPFPGVEVTPAGGAIHGGVGFAHGHTWPDPDVLAADVVCIGHEHPAVRLEDAVGGRRVERVWLRGALDPGPFRAHYGEDLSADGELVVFPAFNDLVGGTWVNVEGQGFLSPFLPDGMRDGQAYLLDGTRLGDYRQV